jgi:hypothetical protein
MTTTSVVVSAHDVVSSAAALVGSLAMDLGVACRERVIGPLLALSS